MLLVRFVVNISWRCMSSFDAWKCWESALGHKSCQAANSKSTDSQQQNADDRKRSVGSAVRSTCAEWQSADVDDQWRLLLAYNCPSSTAEQFLGGIDTWALRAWIVLDRWHRATGAHHAVVATNGYRTFECCWRRGQQNSSLSATCLLWLSATQPAQRYSSRHEMWQILAQEF